MIVSSEELISRIKEDTKIQMKINEPLLINIFNKSTPEVNNQFLYFQLLIDCLLRMKSNEMDKNELITICEKEYQGNAEQLNIIHEFQRDYSSEKALWWYLRESFFYQILNKALNTDNIHMIFLCRSFLTDIHSLLQKYQSTSSIRVYRSQLMSNDELENLKGSIGQFLSMKSFFSASTDRSKLLIYLDKSNIENDLQKVLFEIDADPNMASKAKPFADISSLNDSMNTFEVLFMVSSIFRLNEINYGEDKIWAIRMSLCNDTDDGLKPFTKLMKEQTENTTVNFQTLGKIAWKMGKLDLAERYYQNLLNELASNDPSLCLLYDDLSRIALQKGDHQASVEWLTKAINIEQTSMTSVDSPDEFTDCTGK